MQMLGIELAFNNLRFTNCSIIYHKFMHFSKFREKDRDLQFDPSVKYDADPLSIFRNDRDCNDLDRAILMYY